MTKFESHQLSLINAIALVTLGGYGYFMSNSPSATALIPVFVGLALLAMNVGIKNQNKIIAHIAVLLTLLIIFGLIMPFIGSIQRSNLPATGRTLVMILTSIFSMIGFIKSFKKARKA